MERGETVYDVNCVACHQTEGQGIAGIFPALAGEIALYEKDKHIEIIMEGVSGAAMNSFDYLSEVELAAVIAYTNSLGQCRKWRRRNSHTQRYSRLQRQKFKHRKF